MSNLIVAKEKIQKLVGNLNVLISEIGQNKDTDSDSERYDLIFDDFSNVISSFEEESWLTEVIDAMEVSESDTEAEAVVKTFKALELEKRELVILMMEFLKTKSGMAGGSEAGNHTMWWEKLKQNM
jgi:hypothetical protein